MLEINSCVSKKYAKICKTVFKTLPNICKTTTSAEYIFSLKRHNFERCYLLPMPKGHATKIKNKPVQFITIFGLVALNNE